MYPSSNFPHLPGHGNHHSTLCCGLLFKITHISEIIIVFFPVYLFFCVWLISLRKISSRFIYVVANGRISFLKDCAIFRVCVCTHTYMYVFSLSIPPWVNTEVLCILVIVDNAALNMGVQVSFQDPGVISYKHILRVRLLDYMFLSVWGTFMLFPRPTSLLSRQWCTRVLFSPHPHQRVLFSCLFDSSHSTQCEMVCHCGFNLRFSG